MQANRVAVPLHPKEPTMATTNGASTYDSTMLILFCGSDYYVIDDYNKRDLYAGPTRITDTWPELQHIHVATGGPGRQREPSARTSTLSTTKRVPKN
jgi:hypothetical protein